MLSKTFATFAGLALSACLMAGSCSSPSTPAVPPEHAQALYPGDPVAARIAKSWRYLDPTNPDDDADMATHYVFYPDGTHIARTGPVEQAGQWRINAEGNVLVTEIGGLQTVYGITSINDSYMVLDMQLPAGTLSMEFEVLF